MLKYEPVLGVADSITVNEETNQTETAVFSLSLHFASGIPYWQNIYIEKYIDLCDVI